MNEYKLLLLLPFYGHYTELEDFVGAKFYCPHVIANGIWYIGIREKMLEFSSTVLPAPSPYPHMTYEYKQIRKTHR